MTTILLLILATYRLTLLLVEERGPFAVLDRTRSFIANLSPELEQLLSCFWCLSIWIALALALLTASTISDYFLHVMAGSGGAILLDTLAHKADPDGTR